MQDTLSSVHVIACMSICFSKGSSCLALSSQMKFTTAHALLSLPSTCYELILNVSYSLPTIHQHSARLALALFYCISLLRFDSLRRTTPNIKYSKLGKTFVTRVRGFKFCPFCVSVPFNGRMLISSPEGFGTVSTGHCAIAGFLKQAVRFPASTQRRLVTSKRVVPLSTVSGYCFL